MPKILIVRLSSMGDVIHNLPAITDLTRKYPNADVDWAVEEGFAPIPRLHPGIRHTIPFGLRRWRKSLFSGATLREISIFKQRLRDERYDLVIDSQGLIKSAVVGHMSGAPLAGYDKHSIREPIASWLYDRRFTVSRQLHAVTRNRQITGAVLGYIPEGVPDYGILAPQTPCEWIDHTQYLVFLTATSREDKLWPENNWIELGQSMSTEGFGVILPWGNDAEQDRAIRIAAKIERAVVAPRMTIPEAAGLLAGAKSVIGVDTGLVHLAAAVGTPAIALYCASKPGLTGILASSYHENLGDIGAIPTVNEVTDATRRALERR